MEDKHVAVGQLERHQVLVILASIMQHWKRRVLIAALPVSALAQSPSPRISAIRCGASGAASTVPALTWHGDVVQWAEWPVRLGAQGIRSRIIVARMPAARLQFALDIARRDDVVIPWSLNEAPSDAIVAVNAGQFTDAGPWGWVVHKQKELQPPGVGPLAGAFVVDSAGGIAILTPQEIASWRSPLRAIEAVQSYPMLLVGASQALRALCSTTSGIDLTHRDARLAIGVSRDRNGETQVLLALSRFEAPGGVATRVPIGPTTPEMAEIMRRLGADRAMMLDGGLSAQMLVRTLSATTRWPGLRDVPLALVARLRRD